MQRWSKYGDWNTKICVDTFTFLQPHQASGTFLGVFEEEVGLLSTSYPFVHPPTNSSLATSPSNVLRSPTPMAQTPPPSPQHSHHSHHSLSGINISASSLSSVTTTSYPTSVHIFILLKNLENRFNNFEDALTSRMNNFEERLVKVEERLGLMARMEEFSSRLKKIEENDKNTGATKATKKNLSYPLIEPPLRSIIHRIKERQQRKRKAFTSPYTCGQLKRRSQRQEEGQKSKDVEEAKASQKEKGVSSKVELINVEHIE